MQSRNQARLGSIFETYVNLSVLEAQLQILVDRLVGHFTQQREIGDANILLLGALKDGFLHLWSRSSLSAIADICSSLITAESTTPFLTPATRPSRLTLNREEC
jgi:hypothetical protein